MARHMASITPSPGRDSSSVEDSEFLLRRFPDEPANPQKIPRISIFIPSKADSDGLSLNREGEDFVTAEQVLAMATSDNVRRSGGVVAILTGDVRKDGDMDVDPSPDESAGRGHVVIPQINRVDYDSSKPGKNRIKALADKLVRMATVRIHPKSRPEVRD
jgi:hypothetical protein